MTKEDYMQLAVEQALLGIRSKHGGPFGCVIVKDGKIIGKGHNKVLLNSDPTCHGEIDAIRDACKNIESYDLSGCEIYTTSYPCPMCYGAIQWANIKKVYYGCTIQDADRIGFRDNDFQSSRLDEEQISHRLCLDAFEEYAHNEHRLY